MTFIRFNVKEARDHLILKGFVYTLRVWDKYPEICNAVYNSGSNLIEIGRVKVTKILDEVNGMNQLQRFVYGSGFKNTYTWWHKAEKAHTMGKVFILYKVEANGKN